MARRRAFMHLGRVSIVWRHVLKRWIAQQFEMGASSGRDGTGTLDLLGARRAEGHIHQGTSSLTGSEARISEAVKRSVGSIEDNRKETGPKYSLHPIQLAAFNNRSWVGIAIRITIAHSHDLKSVERSFCDTLPGSPLLGDETPSESGATH